MRGITIADLRETISTMDDFLPVEIGRTITLPPESESLDDPRPVHCRRMIRSLLLEVDDEDVNARFAWFEEELREADKRIRSLEAKLESIKKAVA